MSKYGSVSPSNDVEQLVSEKTESPPVYEKKFSRHLTLALAVLAAFGAALLISATTKWNGGKFYLSSTVFSASDTVLKITTTTAYGPSNTGRDMFPYPFLENALLLEPFRDTTIDVINSMGGCHYAWALTSVSDDGIDHSGISLTDSFNVQPQATGQYTFTVDEVCHSSTSTTESRKVSKDVWVKYVRRELTTLLDDDREEFLDVFHTLWTTSTVEGKLKYGENYKSLYYLAALHNDGGGNGVCDEFHGNVGFINNHVMQSAYLEQSLQLVNPRVALHYMDYTKYFSSASWDQHMENQLDGGAWTELLSSKYFGSSDPFTGRILDGRWESSPVPLMDNAFFDAHGIDKERTFFPDEETYWLSRSDAHMTSPYGLLRAPWNFNPANFTVRYHNVFRVPSVPGNSESFGYYEGVDCDDYEAFITKKVNGQSLSKYLTYAEDDVHGMIHFTFGGIGGDFAAAANEELQDKYGISDECIGESAQAAQKFMKKHFWSSAEDNPLSCTAYPWQDGVLTTTAAPGEDGGPFCTCTDSYFESEESLNELLQTFFTYGDRSVCLATLQSLSLEDRMDAMKLFCNRNAFDGDMAGSGAATDPLFWVAHGAVERLFQKTIFSGNLTDTHYAFAENSKTFCSGHSPDGTKSWLEGLYLMVPSVDASTLTNREINDMLNPTTESHRDLVNFVYADDSFYWCRDSDSWFE